jgi:hypothetical protein
MRIKFSDKTDFNLWVFIAETDLLYLQFRWLPMERNTVYTRWNVGFTTGVMDAMLQARYDAMSRSVCDVII